MKDTRKTITRVTAAVLGGVALVGALLAGPNYFYHATSHAPTADGPAYFYHA